MRAAATCGLQRIVDILGTGRGQDLVHEMRLGGRFRAGTLVLFREDMARTRIHAAVVIGDLEARERVLDPLPDAVVAHRMLDPVERVDRLHLAALIGLVAGLLAEARVDLLRWLVIGEVVFGLLEIVVAAVARRHHRVEAHVLGDREIARRQIGLQLRVDILDLHRAAAVPVLQFDEVEAERFADRFGRAVIGMSRAFERAARIIGDLLVFAGHHSAPFAPRPRALRLDSSTSPT